MWFRKLRRQQAGQPITARTINQTQEVAEWASRLKADPPLAIVTTAFGPLLRLAGPLFGVYIVVTTSTITARSGNSPGSGTAKLQTWDGSVMADIPGPINFTVYNISSSATIASGKYCIVLRISNAYWIITAEC